MDLNIKINKNMFKNFFKFIKLQTKKIKLYYFYKIIKIFFFIKWLKKKIIYLKNYNKKIII